MQLAVSDSIRFLSYFFNNNSTNNSEDDNSNNIDDKIISDNKH
jgi:hypothetical protein